VKPGLPADLIAAARERIRSDQPSEFMLHADRRPAKPLSRRRLTKVERELGFSLPVVLRDVYGSLGNGGFGPGYGLIGLSGGVKSDVKTDIVEDYSLRRQSDHEDAGWFWPAGVLAVCHWGCAIYSCIDCRSDEARILRFDPNPVDADWSVAWGLEKPDMIMWLKAWLNGEEMFEAGTPDGTFDING
jgi:hypothetical protein